MEGLIRQGDILFVPLNKTFKTRPSSIMAQSRYKRVKRVDGDVIVAAGEVTGHHHRVKTEKVIMYRDGSKTYLRVPEGGAQADP